MRSSNIGFLDGDRFGRKADVPPSPRLVDGFDDADLTIELRSGLQATQRDGVPCCEGPIRFIIVGHGSYLLEVHGELAGL